MSLERTYDKIKLDQSIVWHCRPITWANVDPVLCHHMASLSRPIFNIPRINIKNEIGCWDYRTALKFGIRTHSIIADGTLNRKKPRRFVHAGQGWVPELCCLHMVMLWCYDTDTLSAFLDYGEGIHKRPVMRPFNVIFDARFWHRSSHH